MRISEYINFLVNSEAYQLSSKDVGDMSTNPEEDPTATQLANQQKFLGYINLANLEVHKRFQLIKREHEIDYLVDGDETTLPDDFMIPISAHFTSGDREEIPLNNESSRYVDGVDTAVSVMFPEPYVMKIKGLDEDDRKAAVLTYIASPKLATKVSTDLKVPQVYTDALLNYAAYKAHASVSGSIEGDNNTYYMRYEAACKKIKEDGLTNIDNLDSNSKLEDRGFV